MSNEIVQQPGAAVIPAEWAGKLAQYAAETQSAEQSAGQFFSTKSGVLSFGGSPIPGNACDVIVIGSLHENVFYPEKFSAEKVRAPLCYAFSMDGNAMVPHERVAEPQAATCRECPHAQWGSAGEGSKGKACKNLRRLALMPVSSLKDAASVAAATVGYLRVPVTSVKNWSAYAQRLAAGGLPPFASVTKVRLVPDAKTQIRMEFEFVRAITDANALEALHHRFVAEKAVIGFPYPDREPEETVAPAAAPPAPGKQAAASKF